MLVVGSCGTSEMSTIPDIHRRHTSFMEHLASVSNHPIRLPQQLGSSFGQPELLMGPSVAVGRTLFYLQKVCFIRTLNVIKVVDFGQFYLEFNRGFTPLPTQKLIFSKRTLFRLATEQHPNSDPLDNE